MQRPTLALVVFVSLLGLAGSAKADTISFSFVSTPNSSGTYVDASGTFTGVIAPSPYPAELSDFVLSGGTITVVSNVPPTPSVPYSYPQTPELNGSSDASLGSGVFEFSNSPNGIIVSTFCCSLNQVGFLMPGNPAYGGGFVFEINASGLNGAPGNSEIVAGDGGNGPDLYVIDGTLTLSGQAGPYDLTPEPPSWFLLGSGVALLGFMFLRRSMAVQQMS
ncbi:MAG: PEP-CTERM sorting domain-containing protein [Acidobacteriaceae bacterium]